MLSRKAILRAQSFLRLAKPQFNAFKTISNQTAVFSSLSKLHSTKYSQQNLLHLHSPFKFSFSSTPDKNILQKTCLEDLASVKDLLTPEEMTFCETQLKIYSNCRDFSSLSNQEINKIREAFSFLSPHFGDTLTPEKAWKYNHEILVLAQFLQEQPSNGLLDNFFTDWHVYEQSKGENQRYAERARNFHVFERADFERLLQKATQAYEKEVQEGEDSVEDKIGLYLARSLLAFDSQNYEESLRIFEEISPELENAEECCFGYMFATGYFSMAKIHFMKEDAERGVEFCKKSVEAGESWMKYDFMKGFNFYNNAILLQKNGEHGVALHFAEKAHEYFLQKIEDDRALICDSENLLGNLHYELGNYEDALKNYQAVLRYIQKHPSENMASFGTIYMSLTIAYFANNQINEAFDSFKKCREELSKFYGPNSPEVIMALKDWGDKLSEQSSLLPLSLKYFQEAFELHKQTHQDIERELTLLLALGKIQFLLQKYPEAKKSIEACEVLVNQVPNIDTEDKVAIFYCQSMIALKQNEWEKAIEMTKKAMQIPGIRQIGVANCHGHLSVAYNKLGDKQKAEENGLKALEMYASLLGKTHQYTQNYLKSVIQFMEESQLSEKAKRIEEQYRIN